MVLRDIDLLKEIDKNAILPTDLKNELRNGAIVNFSISTLDENLARIVEPGAPKPSERLEAMQKIREEGISYVPVLPFLSDSEEDLSEMIKNAKDYGASFVFVGSLTLFGNGAADSKTLYFKFLEKYYPELLPKYESLYKHSFAPSKEYEKRLKEKSKRLCEKYGIKNRIV